MPKREPVGAVSEKRIVAINGAEAGVDLRDPRCDCGRHIVLGQPLLQQGYFAQQWEGGDSAQHKACDDDAYEHADAQQILVRFVGHS